jgi:maltooligosyltrehalose trehalohydrolase
MAVALELGATRLADGQTQFVVWAPAAAKVKVHLLSPVDRLVQTERMNGDYFCALVPELPAGATYRYRLYGVRGGAQEYPDPASRSQPDGVHGPSAIVEREFAWSDAQWRGLPLADYVIYELHVGAFTPDGTFDAAIERLDALVELGVTAIEIMPVAQCPGQRNWGYDGVFLFAAQYSFGGAVGLKRLVNACHRRGLAVVLDVVYNHLGPEGNYLGQFGPYFTDRYRTPWGEAINYDGPSSDDVRRYFIANALQWIDEFHIDSLRLDAVHAIFDVSARPFLQELADTVHDRAQQLGRPAFLIAETNRNSPFSVLPAAAGGFGLDAQWVDDFGRAAHALFTGECYGHYSDFGSVEHIAKALREGFVLTGQYSRYRRRRHGVPAGPAPTDRFLSFTQNHDEVGNRPGGERIGRLVNFEQLKLAAATNLLSPYIPLLFMGEEYDEPAPFYYFVDHSDPGLIASVRAGRKREIPTGAGASQFVDPQAETSFVASRLNFDLRSSGRHAVLWKFYQRLLALRREHAAIKQTDRSSAMVESPAGSTLVLAHRWRGASAMLLLLNFGAEPRTPPATLFPSGVWHKALDSTAVEWNGVGESLPTLLDVATLGSETNLRIAPWSCALFLRCRDNA